MKSKSPYLWPFGIHKRMPLVSLPTDYLEFVVRESKKPETLFKGRLLQEVQKELQDRKPKQVLQ